MRVPSMRNLEKGLASAAIEIATRLATAGHRGWIVGGALRDLALERSPKDVDMACAAVPAELERLFETSISVGRAFGTTVVTVGSGTQRANIEVTTFRSESEYSDGRRPDRVRYGVRLEEDAARRDFTCNALFLDPLTDELVDPHGGLDDLARRVLRTVGAPARRFAEDGLRLVRMARIAAAADLEPAPETLAAARSSTAALHGVSAERRLGELERIFQTAGSRRAISLLESCGILAELLPPTQNSTGPDPIAVLAGLPDPPGVVAGLAVLLDLPCDDPGPAVERALALRVSRATLSSLRSLWLLRRTVDELAGGGGTRAERLRAQRAPQWGTALDLARARTEAVGADPRPYEELRLEREALDEATLNPEPYLVSADLGRAGLPRGPRWGEVLAEAERRQLEGELTDRESALAWLAQVVRDSD